MKELKRKCFWAGIESKFMILLVVMGSISSGTLIAHGKFLAAIIPTIAAIVCIHSGTQVTKYYLFLKESKKKPELSLYLYDLHEVSRIKLTFSSFLSMYSANTTPWTITETQVMYSTHRFDKDLYQSIETITIVYFDYPDFLKYRDWVKESTKIKQEAAKRKAEAEATETELKLNLQFLDTVTEDVKKMKASAEAEMQRAADELKKAAQPK